MWSLSPEVAHLNHGSFGAVPIPVQEHQAAWRARLEANPTRFVDTELLPALDEARAEVARFVRCDPAGLAFVRNASQGVASVLRSIAPTLAPGDEIVTTNQDYNAVRQMMGHAADAWGAVLRVVEIPFPIDSPSTVTRLVLEAVGERTRLVVVDHVTSPTALVYPVDDIVSALEPDLPVLVDGAHGPGQVPLDLSRLGASWYTGNFHKWVCAPKGSAFLATRADRLGQTIPTVVSHAWRSAHLDDDARYRALFDWTGTDDCTGWLTVPEAIRVVGALEPGGWPALMQRNHEMVIAARDIVGARLGVGPAAPDEMIASMAAVPLPDFPGEDDGDLLSPLHRRLLADGFESIVGFWPGWPHQVLRLSAFHYNDLDQYRALADRVSELVG